MKLIDFLMNLGTRSIGITLVLITVALAGLLAIGDDQAQSHTSNTDVQLGIATYDGTHLYTRAQSAMAQYGMQRAYRISNHPGVILRHDDGHFESWRPADYEFISIDVRDVGPGDAVLVSWHHGAATGKYWRVPALKEPASIWLREQVMTVTVPKDSSEPMVTVRRASDGLLMVPLVRVDQLPVMTYEELTADNGQRERMDKQ